MLNVASDFAITKIEKAEEKEKIVRIYFKYLHSVYKKKGDVNKVYKIGITKFSVINYIKLCT